MKTHITHNQIFFSTGVWILVLVLCFFPVPYGYAESNSTLHIGYADVDITPELGVTMPGYFTERRASGMLDPLLAKALVLKKENTTLAIVALDLIGVQAPLVEAIRAAIEDKTGIPPEHIFLHATHTHTGATVSEIEEPLPAQVAAAVQQALENCVAESTVTYGCGQERRIAFIRRYLMKDGSVRTNPGRANPDVVRPIGEIDPDVHIITFNDAKTALVSYGLHLDCIGGTLFSADYPYHLTQTMKTKSGNEWNVIYLNACCGNVNHINVNDPDQRSGYDESRKIGTRLAETALNAQKEAKPIAIDGIAARCETVQSPVRTVKAEDYEWAKQEMQRDPEEANKRKFNERTPARIIALAETQEEFHPAEIIALRIGPLAIVGMPAEVFVEVGRDIKTHSIFDPTLTIGLTGGSMGYQPHPRGYDEGGYEATYGSARHAPATPILWSDAAGRLLLELHNGAQ
ncbi:MAG: hypothetical protein C4527_17510 [Candidatus Omnitrophota bacterium]|jgi:hypothetical protein|nr:MAG: hypothetical protein C4527_17510 [Candidatus Omnitrophota bacterium]